MSKEAPYGYCPICGKKGIARVRVLGGNDICESGHKYPSRHRHLVIKSEPKIAGERRIYRDE